MRRILMCTILTGLLKLLTGCGGNFFLQYGYNVKGNKVLYKNAFPGATVEVEGADAKTFTEVIADPAMNISSTGFGKDKEHVFFAAQLLKGSDGPSFKVLSYFFAKDKNQCYYRGEVIPGADPASFVVKDETFSLDKNNVYKRGFLMDNNSSIFETFDSSGLVHTTNAVSDFDLVVPIQPGQKFTYLGRSFYALDDIVYTHGDTMPGAEIASFKAIDNFFAKTAHHVYYGKDIIKNANPATFVQLAPPYGKDDQHVFFFERTIEGADPKTFVVLNDKFQCSRDKHTAYHEDKAIQNVTAEDMANTKECIQCNLNKIYFAEK